MRKPCASMEANILLQNSGIYWLISLNVGDNGHNSKARDQQNLISHR